MKKYLLLFLMCVYASIGAWASASITKNKHLNGDQYAATAIRIETTDAGDINSATLSDESSWANMIFVSGPVNEDDIKKLNTTYGSYVKIINLTQATGLEASWLSNLNGSAIEGLGLPTGFNLELSNGNLKVVYSSAFTGAKNNASDSKGDDVINAHILKSGGLTTLYYLQIYGGSYYSLLQYRTINLTGDASFIDTSSPEYTNLTGINGVTVNYTVTTNDPYTVSGCNVIINMAKAEAGKTFAQVVAEAKAAMTAADATQTSICSLTVQYAGMTNADLAVLGDADVAGATRIDLSGVTLASGASIDNIQLPSSLTSLALPKDKTVSTALSARMTAITGLMYAYSPSSSTQDASQAIADYIWVNKAGGLAQALTNESSSLGTSHYIKVASYVALNATDVDMSGKGINAVEYLDLSDANISPNLASDFVKPHNSSYRIILPDGWTADQMAAFNNNSNKGTMVAVYSYTGTTLKVLEIDDNNYMTGALNNPRIVKSGTDAIEVVAKRTSEENAHYGEFGVNLISAINGAASSIKTVNLNLGRGVDTNNRQPIVLTNTNITTLTMQNVASLYSPTLGFSLNVSGCTALTTLDLTGSVLGALDAHNLANLTTVRLNGTMFYDTNGSANLSHSGVTTAGFQTNGSTEFKGTLNLAKTALTSFSTPAKVTGDINLNATSLTSLDLTSTQFQTDNSQIHVHATNDENDTNPISGLNNGTYKTITVPNGFVKTRIHPNDNTNSNALDDNILEEEPTVVASEYTETATDMTFHDKEAGDNTDHYRYWYQGSTDNDGIITLGTSSTTRLNTIISAHSALTSDTHAKIRIVGPLTLADVNALASLNCTALDLSNATSGVDGTTIGELLKAKFQTTGAVHSNTRFIALPDTCSRDFILNATALAGLAESVYCVIAVNDVSNGKDLTSYSFQSGSLQPAVAIFQNSTAQSWTTIKSGYSNTSPKYASTVSTFKKLKIGGLINSYDLAGPAQGINLNDDGHLVFNEAANENDYAQKRTMNGGNTIYGPFSSCFLITEIDLRDAYLEEYGDNTGLGEQYKRYWGEDITLSALGVISTATYKVVIPQDKRVHELPADFMNCSTNIRAICIPSNIQAIRTRAFWTIDYVWTTADAFAEGHDPEGSNTRLDNGAKLNDGTQVNALHYDTNTRTYSENPAFLDSYYTANYSGVNGGGSYTFGSTLKLIESGAFANTQPNVKDVYVLNTTAPECHVDAFNTVMYTGNGGYNPTEVTNEGIITRDAYYNGRWITMLHYPRQTTDPQIQRYTDPTRDYSIATGMRDGKGAILYFPNQSEFIRAYQQGTYGYVWNAWNPTREYGSVNNGTLTNTTSGWEAENQTTANALFDAYTTGGGNHQYTSFYKVSDFTGKTVTAPTTTIVPYYNVNWSGSAYTTGDPGNLYPQSEIDKNNDADKSGEMTTKDYRGWHQFVLNAYAANTVLEEEPYRSYITDNEWWTIVPEFDITLDESALLFGKRMEVAGSANPSMIANEYPKIHKLRYVRREYSGETIYLSFTKDLAKFGENRGTGAHRTGSYTRTDGEITAYTNADQHGSVDGNGIIQLLADPPASNDVVMSAGVPYLIKPNLPTNPIRQYRIFKNKTDADNYNEARTDTDPIGFCSETLWAKIKFAQEMNGATQRAMVKSGTYTVPVFVSVTDGENVVKEAVEMDGNTKKVFTPNDEVTAAVEYHRSTDRHYTFVGTLYKSFLPHYCYFLGWDSANKCAKFYYHNGNFTTIDNEMRWANGTGVIVPVLAEDLSEGKFKYDVTVASDMANPAQWKLLETFKDDSFVHTSGNPAKQYIMDFNAPDMIAVDDSEVTGIENVNDDSNINNTEGNDINVYTINGQKVGTSLEGLPKGIYIVNGKKFIVK